jgi:hypothetical protein
MKLLKEFFIKSVVIGVLAIPFCGAIILSMVALFVIIGMFFM